MGGGSKRPKQDQSLIDAQKKQAADAEAARIKAEQETAAEKEKQADLDRRRRLGRSSLLGTEGEDLGVM